MKLTKLKLKNKFLWSLPAIALMLFIPQSALAVELFGVDLLQIVGEAIFRVVMSPFWLALEIEMWLLPIVAQYNNFVNENGVVTGWIVLRDLSNMFFILILLIISFATIIRVQSYGYKQLLSRLIIVAILINFSRTIVGLAIDFSQVIMLTFVQSIKDIAAGNIVVALGLSDITAAGPNTMSDSTFIQALFLGAVMLVISVFMIGAFIGMLVMRIIKLWILLIMSPLAFLAYVFPKTQGYFNKWVSDLGKNLASGPTLAFFLWLAFTITGRGDIHQSFLQSGIDAGEFPNQVSAAASSDNIINYVIAIVLLAGGLDMVASSGAAGASLAGRVSKGIQAKAGQLGRRYTVSPMSRAGALASRAVIDREGRARGGKVKLFGRQFGWNNVPFLGGRLQRQAMKMQGAEAARIQQEKAEDEKLIQPMHKVEFQASQKGLGGRLGEAYSRTVSMGGSQDRDIMWAQNKVDRGEVNKDNAEEITNHLRRGGDEERMEKVQGNYWTFDNKQEAMRILEKRGLNGIMTDIKSDSLYETGPDGSPDYSKPKQSAIHALEAIFDPSHGHADHNAVAGMLLKNNKLDRWNVANIIKDHFPWDKYFADGQHAFEIKDGVQPDKRGIADNNLSNPAVIAAQALAKIYPQKLGDEFNEKTGQIKTIGVDRYVQARAAKDMQEAEIKPGQIASRLYQWHHESNNMFKKRKDFASNLDRVVQGDPETITNPHLREEFVKDGKIKWDGPEGFQAYRQKMYRQLLGLDAWTETIDGNKRRDYHDNRHIFEGDFDDDEKLRFYAMKYILPKTARNDLYSQKSTVAKETEEAFDIRQRMFDHYEDGSDYKGRYTQAVNLLKKIQEMKPDDNFVKTFGADAWKDTQRRMMAEAVGDKRSAHNWTSKSFWTEVQDGADGSRLMEANVGNPHEAAMLDHALESSENKQQSQAFQVATADQTAYMVDRLSEFGKLPQKVLMDNIPKVMAGQAMQKFQDLKALQAGELPQSFKLLGPNIARLTKAIQFFAERDGKTVDEFIEDRKSASLKQMVDAFNKMYKNQPEMQIDLHAKVTSEKTGKPYHMQHTGPDGKLVPPPKEGEEEASSSESSGGEEEADSETTES